MHSTTKSLVVIYITTKQQAFDHVIISLIYITNHFKILIQLTTISISIIIISFNQFNFILFGSITTPSKLIKKLENFQKAGPSGSFRCGISIELYIIKAFL